MIRRVLRRSSLFLASCLMCVTAFAQATSWNFEDMEQWHGKKDDPFLRYSTYLGGSGGATGQAIAVDKAGNIYVTGVAGSADFPTVNSIEPFGPRPTIYVAKFNPSGRELIYSTFVHLLPAMERPLGIAVDREGNAVVVGFTGDDQEPFVFKLNAQGDAFVYKRVFNGENGTFASAVVVDKDGNAYVTGEGPMVAPGFSNGCAAFRCAFVMKLDPNANLLYGTFLGGTGGVGRSFGLAIAIDSAGRAYITGQAGDPAFPVTSDAFQQATNGIHAFVTKLTPTGDIDDSTFLAGSSTDFGTGIAVDKDGDAVVVGQTLSPDFPTKNPLQSSNAGGWDVFVTKLDYELSNLIYSTYLGGSGDDTRPSVGLDRSGNAHIAGTTNSPDFPLKEAFQTVLNRGACTTGGSCTDAFVAEISPNGHRLIYSSYLGGSGTDVAMDVAVSRLGSTYVAGSTDSSNFPVRHAFQDQLTSPAGDAFISRIDLGQRERGKKPNDEESQPDRAPDPPSN